MNQDVNSPAPEAGGPAKNPGTEWWRAIKFGLISCSAGLIQFGSFTLLNEFVKFPSWIPTFGKDYGPAYLIALILSVLWNFTINSRYTFKSAANIPIAMLKVFGYYCVFTPVTVIAGDYCTGSLGWNSYLVLIVTMVLNLVTEYLFCRLVVYRKSMDSNDIAKGQASSRADNRAK